MPSIKILNTEFRDQKVLVLHGDAAHVERLVSALEQDPSWAGLNVYGVSEVDEARKIARAHSIDLAVFPQEVAGKDFVTIQQELKKAHPAINMIPLLEVPSISQLRESRRAGGVIDYGDLDSISSPEKLKVLLQGYFRDQVSAQLGGQKKLIEYTSGIQRALLIDHPDWVPIKHISSGLVGVITSNFDITPSEASLILGAEKIYMPWLSADSYTELLGVDTYQLAPILKATGSWGAALKRPTSVQGLIVTASNLVAEGLALGKTDAQIQELISSRPEMIKHVAIRTLGPEALVRIFARISELRDAIRRTG